MVKQFQNNFLIAEKISPKSRRLAIKLVKVLKEQEDVVKSRRAAL